MMNRVIFIGGYGRSGSTLVERLLGQVEGFCAVGELRHIWERSFGEDQLCGCGLAFRACGFWSGVVERAFGGFDRVDVEKMLELQRAVDRTRFIPQSVAGMPRGFRRRLDEYTSVLARLYEAIGATSGCRFIIDSSKEPSHGFLLGRVAGVEPYVLHVVRDSRAVAFSWVRRRERPEVHWERRLMDVHSPLKSIALWMAFNGLCQTMRGARGVYRRVRYEDFVADPNGTLRPILSDLDHGTARLDFLAGRRAVLQANHTVSGNPMRFVVGDLELKLDREWRDAMNAADRRLVTALTLPLLLAYGYVRPRRRAVPTGDRVLGSSR